MLEPVQPHFGKEALSTHESSHDTFDASKFRNWLANEAGIGTYAHGRIHQEVGYSIYVGDLIHKRGHLVSDDILLMEEQETLSHSDPLTAPSRLGRLMAFAMLPTMNTANGEGSLVAYYQHGVVAFDTFEAPRETRHDVEGVVIQKGWDTKRLVNHLLNTVGAVGRYAVTVLTRDHLFRSSRGLHFLKVILGEGTFNSENTNRISMDVDPLLDADCDLAGAACGFWWSGNRMFATTGLVPGSCYSSTSMGRGFVSWNQAVSYTEDRTPLPLWEGLWTVDHGIAGIHNFASEDRRNYGVIASDRQSRLYFGELTNDEHDTRNGDAIPIEWSFETGRFAPAGLGSRVTVNDLVIELVASSASQKIRVLSRTDADGEWRVWKTFSPADKVKTATQKLLITEALGRPAASQREATWIQVRVEGVGATEIRLLDLDVSPSTVKAGRSSAVVVSHSEKDFFEINSSPISERWQ